MTNPSLNFKFSEKNQQNTGLKRNENFIDNKADIMEQFRRRK